jgi:hypothetical protein
MARYDKCIGRLMQAAGRKLTDAEIGRVFERIHQAALAIKRGEAVKPSRGTALGPTIQSHIEAIAKEAAEQMKAEAALTKRQAALQITALGARMGDIDQIRAAGIDPIRAPEKLLFRDYTGKLNIESVEQRYAGIRADLERQLMPTWESLGSDFLGLLQHPEKMLTLIRELRGEDTGDAIAKKGAEAFHKVAESARVTFNRLGGDIGRLDDWGMPQHHSQVRVADAGLDAWRDDILPLLDRSRYVDENGFPWDDSQLRAFLEHAYDTISTDGISNLTPGAQRGGKRANRHAESRQIHFKDAESVIDYWSKYGEKTVLEILTGHIETMAKDIALVEKFGPNPTTTFRTLRDQALQDAVMADRRNTKKLQGEAARLDVMYEYVTGATKPSVRPWLSSLANTISHLNVAGKLGGAAIASLYGDKPLFEAVSHINDIPEIQRWQTELSALDPTNPADRQLLMGHGLMLDYLRGQLNRFYDGLAEDTTGGALGRVEKTTGKIANAVMRITGMGLLNEGRKGAFGIQAMASIGRELGKPFDALDASDVRLLKTWGIRPADWGTWQLATRETVKLRYATVENVLTPEAIARIPDDALRQAGVIGQADGAREAEIARRDAIVKLLGAVNTESEFAVVTPGWRERAQMYSGVQRGTVKGEIWRSFLQFKSFPWAVFQRGMDLVANQPGAGSKGGTIAYLVFATTLAGAMTIQTRAMLAGQDPRAMFDEKNWWKFWGAAFVQGGGAGIYGDFLSSANQTRYGTGVLEVMAGPTIGPLLEMGVTGPLAAARAEIEGRDHKLAAVEMRNLKGFVPGGNIWYAKAALDHLIFMQAMEAASPGYLNSIRARTQKEYGQSWWWQPGELAPDRAPDVSKAFE